MSIGKFLGHTLGAAKKNAAWSWGAADRTRERVYLQVWDKDFTERDGQVRFCEGPWDYSQGLLPTFY